MKMKRFRYFIHPILFASYTILALFTHNLGEVQAFVLFRPLVFVIIFALILIGGFRLVLKKWSKAGLMASWSLLLFLTYGRFHRYLNNQDWASLITHHRLLLPFWGLLFLVGFFLLLKSNKKFDKLSLLLNIVVMALVVINLFSIARHALAQSRTAKGISLSEGNSGINLTMPKNPPDIYYILLDGYTREDVLSTKFGFDNSEFIDSLEELGFMVAECSRSNYKYTHLSLPSLMNMEYIDSLVGEIPEGATIESLRFIDLTQNNQVMQSLGSIGYEIVAFETSYYWAQFSEADIYYEPVKVHFFAPSLSEFEKIYLETTMILALMDWDVLKNNRLFQTTVMPNETHALRIQFTLDKLKELPKMEGSQFVLAHLVVPHSPYIFNAEGVIPNLREYDESWENGELGQAGYINNIRYINQEILQVVQKIIEESAISPIIILQADHGSDFYDRTMILSAFHIPGVAEQALYADITPLNTFRLVFKHTFDASLELLPDRTFSGEYPPFDFHEIEETYPHCLDHDK